MLVVQTLYTQAHTHPETVLQPRSPRTQPQNVMWHGQQNMI